MLNEDLLTGSAPTTEVDNYKLATALAEDLLGAARAAQSFAYAPYSNFAVGAALLLSDGAIYRGANIENASFGLTVCAERVALFNAVSEGRIDIAAIALVTSSQHLLKPCGSCRQVIAEFSKADNPIIIISTCASGQIATETICDLLPDSFTLL